MAARSKRKLIKLADVAEKSGVSLSTASMALSDHPDINAVTQSHVKKTAKEMGYRPLRTRKKPVARDLSRIGFVLFGHEPSDIGYSKLIFALSQRARELNMRFEVTHFKAVEGVSVDEGLPQFCMGVDAVILCGIFDERLLGIVQKTSRAVLILGHTAVTDRRLLKTAPMVVFDDLEMGRLATARLLAADYTRIACICWKRYRSLSHDQFISGYQLAHLQASVSFLTDNIIESATFADDFEGIVRRIHRSEQRPDSYVFADARLAAEFINAMKLNGTPLAADNVVIMDNTNRATEYGIDSYPLIYGSIDDMARSAFYLIRSRIDNIDFPVLRATLPIHGI